RDRVRGRIRIPRGVRGGGRRRCAGGTAMNILIVSSEFPPGPGGIGTHAHQLASGFASLGWKPLVLTSQDYASDEEIGRFNQAQPFPVVRFRRIGNPLLEAFYREAVLGRWIRKHSAQ